MPDPLWREVGGERAIHLILVISALELNDRKNNHGKINVFAKLKTF